VAKMRNGTADSYLLYKLSACWSANVRAEWLRDDDGVRIAGRATSGVCADGRGFAGNLRDHLGTRAS
jgi:hypothetical protein